MILSLENLIQLEKIFPDQYTNLFEFGFRRLKRAHTVKLHAIKYCKKYLGIQDPNDIDSAIKRGRTGLDEQKALSRASAHLNPKDF